MIILLEEKSLKKESWEISQKAIDAGISMGLKCNEVISPTSV